MLENVTLAPLKVLKKTDKDAQDRAERLLQRVNMWDKRDAYPVNYLVGKNNVWPSHVV